MTQLSVRNRLSHFALAFLTSVCLAQGQDVMLQAWYWDYPKDVGAAAWAERIRAEAADLGRAGFTHVWLPPLSRASFGQGSNGYDPKDLYDLGEFGQGPTGYGTRAQVDASIAALDGAGISAVADVVYNHRDGGAPEVNPAVKAYITQHFDARKRAFPSDRYYVRLPLGGTSGNGPGEYYFKLSSKTADARFLGDGYKLYMRTSRTNAYLGTANEQEPNGGGDCGQTFQDYALGTDLLAFVDDPNAGCGTDEFRVTLTAADIAAGGDFLDILLTNTSGGYSDHRFYGVYSTATASDVVAQLEYLTYTDFTSLPSGRGGMTFENFRPNSATANTTFLDGDYEYPWFFYDYDQANPNTRQVLFDWTDFLVDEVGIGGLRMDAVKHFDPGFVGQLLQHLEATGRAPSIAVGEFFDGNVNVLADWIRGVRDAAPGISTPVRAFDFSLRNALKEACDNDFYDVRNVFQSGIVDDGGLSGFNAVTFVNNHDFRGPGEPIQRDAVLGYAYILTNNQVGLPTVFYPDYAGASIPNAPVQNLKSVIDSLIAFQRNSIAGASGRDYLNAFGSGFGASYLPGSVGAEDVLIYQLRNTPNGRDVIVAINFGESTLKVDQTINQGGGRTAGTRFDKVIGRAGFPFAEVDAQGRVYLEVPANSFAVWQQAGPVSLPVELLSFGARPSGKTNELHWTVAKEVDLVGYVVERSETGAADDFGSLVRVNATGTPDGRTTSYVATDPDPAMVTYYRLRSEDADGTTEVSEVVSVRREDARSSLSVYPNPTDGAVTLSWDTAAGPTDITVTDAVGRRVLTAVAETQLPYTLPTETLPAGTYQVSVIGRDWMESARLVVR